MLYYFVLNTVLNEVQMRRINYQQDIKPLSEFRAGVSSCVQQVTETKRPMILTQHGRGVAVLVDVGEFEAMQNRLELLDEIYRAEAQLERGEGLSHAEAKDVIIKRIKA
jgi:prevent-host-death family protein